MGQQLRMIPVADVVCFEATEKYVNVVTPTGEALVRMSLRELMTRIDSTDFIQVHRSVMVNSCAILSATRDENGHYSLAVRGLQRPLVARLMERLLPEAPGERESDPASGAGHERRSSPESLHGVSLPARTLSPQRSIPAKWAGVCERRRVAAEPPRDRR